MQSKDLIDCNDPQFMNTLKSCLKSEISELKNTLSGQRQQTQMIKADVALKYKEGKDLDERIKNSEKNISTFTSVLQRFQSYNSELANQIALINANMDDSHFLINYESKHHDGILYQYKETWEEYQAKYEELPLAQERKAAKIHLQKLEIEKMVTGYKLEEIKKKMRLSKKISWLCLRVKIVQFAEEMLKNRGYRKKLELLNSEAEEYKLKLNAIQTELETECRKWEEANKMRSLKILEMPPPIMDLPKANQSNKVQQRSYEPWKRVYESFADTDSVSINPSILEELCINEDPDYYLSHEDCSPYKTDKHCKNETITSKCPLGSNKDPGIKENSSEEVLKSSEESGAKEEIEEMKFTQPTGSQTPGFLQPEDNPTEEDLEQSLSRVASILNPEDRRSRPSTTGREKIREPETKKMKMSFTETAEETSSIWPMRPPLPRIRSIEKVRTNFVLKPMKKAEEDYCESEEVSSIGSHFKFREGSIYSELRDNCNFEAQSNVTSPFSVRDIDIGEGHSLPDNEGQDSYSGFDLGGMASEKGFNRIF